MSKDQVFSLQESNNWLQGRVNELAETQPVRITDVGLREQQLIS